jgi:para-nitrobenzyl esterase
MTGKGQDRYALADRMAKAWVAFARTGNPSHAGLPAWGAFNTTTRTTMIFDKECRVVNDPNGVEQRLLRKLQTLA